MYTAPTEFTRKQTYLVSLPVLTLWRRQSFKKLLGIIGRVRLCPSCSFATALDSDINQTTGSGGHLSMWENRCMHAAVCLLRAGQPRSAGDAAKLGQFIGQFSWVAGDPIGVKGLCTCMYLVWYLFGLFLYLFCFFCLFGLFWFLSVFIATDKSERLSVLILVTAVSQNRFRFGFRLRLKLENLVSGRTLENRNH